jgi:predicted TIM-barrel fold metal-dependent hydrolase
MLHLIFRVFLAAALLAAATSRAAEPAVPLADHHQHLFSPMVSAMSSQGGGTGVAPLAAAHLVTLLDSAGIRRATVLSLAYMYGRPGRKLDDEYGQVRRENDWTAAQAAQYPARLVAFCSFNPLSGYALDELARCAATPGLRAGIKLHFGNSDVQLDVPGHVQRLREVFAAANKHRMAIVVHMRASISKKRPYGAAQAQVFLEQVLPMAPDVPVQVAHFAGTGPGYDDPPSEQAMEVLASAVEKRDPRTRQLWFDVASLANGASEADAQRLVRRIRQVGVGRILYGSDSAAGDNLRPREAWAAFQQLPLSQDEVKRIAHNLAPYFR